MDIAKSLVGIFKIKDVNSDNVTFKLFYKVSFGLCLFSSLLVAATQYWGDAIECNQSTSPIDAKVFERHCWIHGTERIKDSDDQKHMNCVSRDVTEDNKSVVFYQWVTFMLLINAAIFRIPYIIWKLCEGGLMKSFCSEDTKSLYGRGKKDDVTVKELLVEKACFFNKLRGQMGWYYFTFFSCQILNVGMVIVNFVFTNIFLSHNFKNYGLEVIGFLSKTTEQQKNADFNPLCNAFPTVTNCVMNYKGTAGSPVDTSGVCILSQNIINQKIYFVLWFWFIIMTAIGVLQILFELSFLTVPAFRSWVITLQMGKFDTNYVRKYVDQKCAIGDWFLLYQIGKNMDKHVFRLFLESVSQVGGKSQPKKIKSIEMNDIESQKQQQVLLDD